MDNNLVGKKVKVNNTNGIVLASANGRDYRKLIQYDDSGWLTPRAMAEKGIRPDTELIAVDFGNNDYAVCVRPEVKLMEGISMSKEQIKKIIKLTESIVNKRLNENGSYYRTEFSKISAEPGPTQPKIQIMDAHAKTKWIDLNNDSVPELIGWLQRTF